MLIPVHMAPRKVCPYGYEKSPSHVDYSFRRLKLVRVRDVRGSNPAPRLESTRLAQKASRVILNGTLIRGPETAGPKALNGKGALRAHTETPTAAFFGWEPPPGRSYAELFVKHPVWRAHNERAHGCFFYLEGCIYFEKPGIIL